MIVPSNSIAYLYIRRSISVRFAKYPYTTVEYLISGSLSVQYGSKLLEHVYG